MQDDSSFLFSFYTESTELALEYLTRIRPSEVTTSHEARGLHLLPYTNGLARFAGLNR